MEEEPVVTAKAAKGHSSESGGNTGNRRPMNAFLLFCKRHRAIVKEVYPNLENRHITKILGEFWGSLSPNEKMPFNDLAATYKDHLMREQPANFGSRGKQIKTSEPDPPAAPSSKDVEMTEDNKSAVDVSQGSSGSSSPEPGSGSSSAPKPFKKRYLAAEKAKICSSGESSERKSACEALLKLAEGGSSSDNNSKANANACNGNVKSNPYDKIKETAQFSVLRQAVWTRVAKTILTQEEEKGKNATTNQDDKPINLSAQCLIPNSTIIEHIIENILNDNGNDIASANNAPEVANVNSNECSEQQIKDKIYQGLKEDVMRRTVGGGKDGSNDLTALWKMLPNPTGGLTKKNGIHEPLSVKAGGKEKAHSAPASQSGSGAPSPKSSAEPSVSVTLVTETDLPLNLSKTPPQTPASGISAGIAITITTTSPAKRKLLEDDDDEVRRSSRACKGRRYQEFKDAVGRRGRRACGKSDGESSQHSEDEHSGTGAAASAAPTTASSAKSFSVSSNVPSLVTSKEKTASPFDLEKALMDIPALRPEEFQRRIQANRQQQKSSMSPSSQRYQVQDDQDLPAAPSSQRTKAQKGPQQQPQQLLSPKN